MTFNLSFKLSDVITIIALTVIAQVVVRSIKSTTLWATPESIVWLIGLLRLVIPGLFWVNERINEFDSRSLDQRRAAGWPPKSKAPLMIGWYALWSAVLVFAAFKFPSLATASAPLIYFIFALTLIALGSTPYFADSQAKQEFPRGSLIIARLSIAFSIIVVLIFTH